MGHVSDWFYTFGKLAGLTDAQIGPHDGVDVRAPSAAAAASRRVASRRVASRRVSAPPPASPLVLSSRARAARPRADGCDWLLAAR